MSLDQIGPFARTVEDVAGLLGVISGHDQMDSTSAPVPVPSYREALRGGLDALRIGVPREYFPEGLNREVRNAVLGAVDCICEECGAERVDISLPHTEYAVATYYIVATAEASSNLARYDGVKYGSRVRQPRDMLDMYERTRAEGFGKEVQRRIMLGTYTLSAGYYDAYYLKALRVRTLFCRDYERAFEQCDVIVVPTSPTPAFGIGEKTEDPLEMYLSDIFTIPVNLAGLPALSMPCGYSAEGLPIGVQVIAPAFKEELVLRVAHAYEQSAGYELRLPEAFAS